MSRRERRAAAKKPQAGSNADATSAAALCEIGLNHLRAERFLEAQISCKRALAVDCDHADALHLMGLLSVHAGQYDLAVEWTARAIQQDPKAKYLASLGNMLQRQGRLEEALKAFDKAVQLEPDAAELWKYLGKVLLELNHSTEALLSFQHVLKLDAHHWDAANECGMLLHKLGRLEEALSYFSLCDVLQPNHAATLHMRTICLCGLKRFEEALANTRRAQALDPTNADICNAVGVVLQPLGRDEEALEWFDRALKSRPVFAAALHNKAASLTKIRRLDEAFAIYDGLKAADPNDALAVLGLAHLHMLTGNFEAGWAGREARWNIPSLSSSYPKLSQPMWLGNGALEGKTILIGADEGLGDTIQFARYIPMVAERGAHVVLVVQDTLHLLLSGLPGVTRCLAISQTGTLPQFDIHCPMMSLPLAFGTSLNTIPSSASYLPRPAEALVRAWEDRLGRHDRLRVGLVWSGNPKHGNDHNRSMPLRALTPILDADATFVSLQKDPRPADKAALREMIEIIDPTDHLTDFSDTAALISCLDVVITVDTSVAHLAGALGHPTWILLPYVPDYRWLLDRDDSPWYPTVRLFRQDEGRDYARVLERVRQALGEQILAFNESRAGR